MRILGIDPGLGACGVALLEDGELTLIRTIRISGKDLAVRVKSIAMAVAMLVPAPVDILSIEHMQVYQRGKSKGDPNDLVDLALLTGAVLTTIEHKRSYLVKPAEWKGQTPKPIHHRRIRESMPDIGRASVDAMDALALALYGQRKEGYRAHTEKRLG